MLSHLRSRFGIPGVISVIALVFAMMGGAYAANNTASGGKATASAKAKQGPRGKTGKTGPAGPAGPQGPAGANGKDGANGNDGANGAPGAPGASVTSEEFGVAGKEGKCVGTGGSKFTAGAGKTFACNGEPGEPGEPGPEGSPWTAAGKLPAGATETGTWAFNASDANATIFAPISFTIPLGPGIFASEGHAHFQSEEGFSTFCEGSKVEPSASPGELCVYYNTSGFGTGLGNATFEGIGNAGSSFSGTPAMSGAILRFAFSGEAGEGAFGFGSWAVTGCSTELPEADPSKCPE